MFFQACANFVKSVVADDGVWDVMFPSCCSLSAEADLLSSLMVVL